MVFEVKRWGYERLRGVLSGNKTPSSEAQGCFGIAAAATIKILISLYKWGDKRKGNGGRRLIGSAQGKKNGMDPSEGAPGHHEEPAKAGSYN